MTSRSLLHGWTAHDAYQRHGFGHSAFHRAKGIEVEDVTGTRFLDARSLVWNVSFGHGWPEIVDAVTEQIARLACGPTIDGQTTMVADRLADRLISIVPGGFSNVYLSLSGTAANETAITMARAHHKLLGRHNKTLIVSQDRGYHGQSIAMASLSGFSALRDAVGGVDVGGVQSPAPYCFRCPWDQRPDSCKLECASDLVNTIERVGADKVAAMIIEPVQGSVVQEPPKGYIDQVQSYLKDRDILLIVDEVATGFGRLGTPFATELFGLEPDILTLAKAITNGVLPLAATLAKPEVMQPLIAANWTPPFGSTQDGNPVCAAAALAALDLFEREDWSGRCRGIGQYLLERLQSKLAPLEIVGDVRGVGLFLAIELVANKRTLEPYPDMSRVSRYLLEEKILVQLDGSLIILAPPFLISQLDADEIVQRLAAALVKLTAVA